jgi:hypothetical protein
MTSRQSRRIDRLGEKIPLEARLEAWVQAVAEATGDGASWERAGDEHRAWLSEIEETVPDEQWAQWERQRSDLLSIYGIAAASLRRILQRFVRATMHLAVCDLALLLRQGDQGAELAESLQALAGGTTPARKTEAASSSERVTDVAASLHAGADRTTEQAPDALPVESSDELGQAAMLSGTILMDHIAAAEPDDLREALIPVARQVLDHAAQFEAARGILRQTLADQGQQRSMPSWESMAGDIARRVAALRESHSAFGGYYEPRLAEAELEGMRKSLEALHYCFRGFANVLSYYDWLEMDAPLHPVQRRRADLEHGGLTRRPRPRWETPRPLQEG